jgi:hypothetical protein
VGHYYNVDVTMTNFRYTQPLDEVLDQHRKLDLVETTTVINCSPATTSDEVTIDRTKTQTYTISMEQSLSWVSRYCNRFSVTAGVSANLFGIFDASVSTTAEVEWELGQESRETRGSQLSTTNEYKISVKKTVNIPEDQCIKVLSYVKWISDLALPYTATINVKMIRIIF